MKRLLLVAMLVLFLLPAVNTDSQNSQPFGGSVAVAGRTQPGMRSCECGQQDCVCDPNQNLTVQKNTPQEIDPVNLGTTFSLVVGAAFLVLRLRQLI